MAAAVRAAAWVTGLVVLVLSVAPVMAQPPPPQLASPPTDPAVDAAFRCPESLADDAERRAALVAYFHWAAASHPDWSVADAVEFRKRLLQRHACTASLRDLADYAKRERE